MRGSVAMSQNPRHARLIAVDPVIARLAQIGHQPVEIGTDAGDLLHPEHVEGLHETPRVVMGDLVGAQPLSVTFGRGPEPEVDILNGHVLSSARARLAPEISVAETRT